MKPRDVRVLVSGLALVGMLTGGAAVLGEVLGTAISYHGRLTDSNLPANGEYDFQFTLYDADTAGGVVGGPVTEPNVEVTNGIFMVAPDFGSDIFTGDALWLEVSVRAVGDPNGYTLLDPRQRIRPAPYALALPALWTRWDATSPSVIGGYIGNSVTSGAVGATISGGGSSGAYLNRVTDNYGTVGGGKRNQAGNDSGSLTDADYATVSGGYTNTASDDYATVGGGYVNTATGSASTVGGGQANDASENRATVAGGSHNIASGSDASVGGGYGNDANGPYATVGGGYENSAIGDYATVGGGYDNDANGAYATVAGGYGNTVNGVAATVGGGLANETAGFFAAVAGGKDNTASALGGTVGGGWLNAATEEYATVAGGFWNDANGLGATIGGGGGNNAKGSAATIGGGGGNTAFGDHATVSGGSWNDANAPYATIPGGRWNDAWGDYSFAAGSYAKAYHNGAFVWGDTTVANVASTGDDQFIVRARGGVWFGSIGPVEPNDMLPWKFINTSTGGYLSTGGSWVDGSDAAKKENFTPVEGKDLVERVAKLPITQWNYKAEDPAVRHIGPTAQDFHAAFGVGADDRHIASLDTGGVALGAIQGLYEIVKEKDARIAAQEKEMSALRARLAKLEAMVGDLADTKNGGAR